MKSEPISDLKGAFELETMCYPVEEACSWENMQYRYRVAPHLFLGAFMEQQIVGLIMATGSMDESITHSSMSRHDSEGKTVCIHSVCVHPNYRRQSIATKLLTEYLKQIKSQGMERVSLICHDDLIPLYERVGFVLCGISPIVHGPDPWFEMNLIL
jgi:ribosomal protein S18 acetylase RimI-like enzyme